MHPWEAGVAIPCADGKSRRTEPSIFPLAHGVSGRVGLLRGSGNAIVPQVADIFIEAYLDTLKP
jgi:DNA (cytosine-5)-methyltransferase 1